MAQELNRLQCIPGVPKQCVTNDVDKAQKIPGVPKQCVTNDVDKAQKLLCFRLVVSQQKQDTHHKLWVRRRRRSNIN